MDKYIFDNVN